MKIRLLGKNNFVCYLFLKILNIIIIILFLYLFYCYNKYVIALIIIIRKYNKNLKLKNEVRLEETINKEEYNNKIQEKIKEKSTEEWIEIMKIIGLNLEEFDNFLNNKSLSKLIEALELLNRLLNDKNLQIKILEDENQNLNSKNYNLNKENIFLFQKNIELKKHLEKYLESKNSGSSINKTSNIETNDSSLVYN